MKKEKSILLILVTLLFTGYVYGSVGIAFQFANKQIVAVDDDYYLEFDILVNATESGTQHNMLQMFIEYNTEAFGTNVCWYDNTTVTRYPLLAESHYRLSYRDSNAFIYAINTEAFNEYNLLDLPVTPTPLVHVSMRFQEVSQNTGVIFLEEWMIDQQYYGEDFTPYDNPPIIINALDDLDDSTVPVVLSSFTATTSVDNLVNLTWVTQTETEVQGFYIYRAGDLQLDEALRISPLIAATNTSQVQVYVYKDEEIFAEGDYYYWLQVMNLDGTIDFHGPISFNFAPHGNSAPPAPLVTGINPYPNPFNPDLTISYSLQNRGPIKMQILNTKGQLITTLVEGLKESGRHTCRWNGKDQYGKACGSGLYYVRMITTDKTYNSKVVLMK
ncbi:MAG: T9SS type A sorting domain-containing protein [Candidatus Cloacimonetes bacterium]|nr:T9SS type A sorting domain-containing protein [Candidatus Cloacimonadota bacterium]